jgi:predicted Zn-dependent peptidase
MRKTYFFLTFILFFSIVQADSVFKDAASRLKTNIKKVTFENGLTLIMLRRTTSPTLALYTKFKVGSSDEIPEMSGTAHMLEHMLFKGTANIGTTDFKSEKKYYTLLKSTGHELDQLNLEKRNLQLKDLPVSEALDKRILILSRRLKAIEDKEKEFTIPSEDFFIYDQQGQVGFNAYTNNDVTNYQIKLPSNRLEIWAKMESDRLKGPILREYYTERNVIMEERRMRVENRGLGILREKYLSLAFDRSAYGRPVIGYESNIPFLDIYETEAFFKAYYSPDNMVIGIVGDLDFDKTEEMIKKYFGDLQPSKNRRKEQRIIAKFNLGERRITFKHPGGSILLLGWQKPAYPHKDSIVFELIDSILTKGARSKLYQQAVLKEKLVSSISAWTSDPGERFQNLFTIFANLNEDVDAAKLETIIWEEIDKLKKGEITEEEIAIAKNQAIADFLRDVDSNASLADGLTFFELVTGNWEDMFISYDKFNAVSKEDIVRVINKYFTKENMTAGFLDSRGTK